MRERVQTRNFRHPNMAIPPGTSMESPTGIVCTVVGPSDVQPGRLLVEFHVNGRRFVQGMWPSRLRGFKMNGVTL